MTTVLVAGPVRRRAAGRHCAVGTPAFFHPWKNATCRLFAPAHRRGRLLAAPKGAHPVRTPGLRKKLDTPRHNVAPPPTAALLGLTATNDTLRRGRPTRPNRDYIGAAVLNRELLGAAIGGLGATTWRRGMWSFFAEPWMAGAEKATSSNFAGVQNCGRSHGAMSALPTPQSPDCHRS